jgi:hypothetical protein
MNGSLVLLNVKVTFSRFISAVKPSWLFENPEVFSKFKLGAWSSSCAKSKVTRQTSKFPFTSKKLCWTRRIAGANLVPAAKNIDSVATALDESLTVNWYAPSNSAAKMTDVSITYLLIYGRKANSAEVLV